jgi:putative lipoprotein
MKPKAVWAFSSAVWLVVAGFWLVVLADDKGAGTNEMKTIKVSVWYRERMMLPPNAEITVSLEDVSKMDVAANVIATTTVPAVGGPPWGLAMEYDSPEIDNQHRYAVRARIEVNGQLMFTNTTQIPAFSGVEGKPLEILVSRVGDARGGQSPASNTPNASLTNTYWKLVELDGKPAALGAGGQELHIVLTSEGNSVRGFSGCNRFTGGYEVKDNQLRFKELASTMMACMEGMELEQRFLENLGESIRFTISSGSLALYSGDERLMLRFEAILGNNR